MPKNKKGMTLMEMMVVVIVIAGLIAMAYPTYMSALEKARAQEAVQLVSHLVAAQDRFRGECYDMVPATGECLYSADFSRLPVQIAGPNQSENITVTAASITTPGFIYTMSGAGAGTQIIATTRRANNYAYTITAQVGGAQVLCNVTGGGQSGKKICSAIGKPLTAGSETTYLIN